MWLHALFVVCVAFVQLSIQASCTIQANTQYGNNADLVTLFDVSSAQACCDACEGFEECNYFTYVKNPTLDTYKQCIVKSNRTAGSSSSSTSHDSGYNNRVYTRRTACSQEAGYDYFTQANLGNFPAATSTDCCNGCAARPGCQYWTLTGNTCYMKAAKGNRSVSAGLTSGTVIPPSTVPKRTGSKRGLGIYGTKSCSDIKLLSNKVTWVYNWAENPDVLEQCYEELGIQFIPMIWGLGSRLDIVYGKSPYLLTFNEPNFVKESNITAKQAADFWPKIEAVAAKYNMKISSPSASYGGEVNPIEWLDNFFDLCRGCKVDFITTHQYDCRAVDMHALIGLFKKYNKPIWVTEFACYSRTSEPEVFDFAGQILPKFDNETSIERYAWFGIRSDESFNNIFDNSKKGLTRTGELYAGSPSTSSTTSLSTVSTSSSSSSPSSTTSSPPSSSSSSPSSSVSASSSSSPSSTSTPGAPSSAAGLYGSTVVILSVVFVCIIIGL